MPTLALDFPLEFLIEHLLTNHDPDWRFETIEYRNEGLALNCYLPTDSEETYIVVDASTYDVNEVGKNVPPGLRDEIQEKVNEGLHIDLHWNDVGLDEMWA